jgi:hypothetical protein
MVQQMQGKGRVIWIKLRTLAIAAAIFEVAELVAGIFFSPARISFSRGRTGPRVPVR